MEPKAGRTERSTRRMSFILLFAVVWLAAGCGGSDTGPGQAPGIALYGLWSPGGVDTAGAEVALVDERGNVLPGPAVVMDEHGRFVIQGIREPARAAQLVITTPEGIVFERRLEPIVDGAFVHVHILTTLEAAYAALRPDLSAAERWERIRDFLGIAEAYDLNDGLVHPYYSGFSPEAFLEAAIEYPGGVNPFVDSLAERMDDPVGAAGPERFLGDSWFQYTYQELNITRIQVFAPSIKVAEKTAEAFSGGAIAKGLITNVVGALIKHLAGAKERDSIENILDGISAIESQLKQMISMLADLANFIVNRFNVSDYTNLSNQIAPDINAINTAYGYLKNASVAAAVKPDPDTTDLDNQIQSLYLLSSVEDFYNHAQNIHSRQWGTDPHSGNMISLARSIVGADRFVSDLTQTQFTQQARAYVGYQTQAATIVAAKSQPGLLENAAQPYEIRYNFLGNVGGTLNNASRWVSTLIDNMQEEMSFTPLPLVDKTHVYGIATDLVYHQATLNTGSGGDKIRYAEAFFSGGLDQWKIGTSSIVQDLIRTYGGSTELNKMGFNLQPGPVTWHKWEYYQTKYKQSWVDYGEQIATSNGYVTLDVGSDKITIGWVDDSGNSGTFGYCHVNGGKYDIFACAGGDDPAASIDTEHIFYYGQDGRSTPIGAGGINGPMILVNTLDAANYLSGAQAVATAKYSALNVVQGIFTPFIPDPYGNGTSGTQPLKAYPVAVSGGPWVVASQELTSTVFWSAWDPDNPTVPVDPSVATISNLPQPADPPEPSPTDIPSVPQKIGVIHWKPASAGRSVLFTATRYKPDGSVVSGQITLASPVVQGTQQSHCIDVFPTALSTTNDYLRKTGFGIYTTRHYASCGSCSGNPFEDVSTQAGITYESSHPEVAIVSGLVKLIGADLPAGTEVTIIATDTASAIRPEDTCTIHISQ